MRVVIVYVRILAQGTQVQIAHTVRFPVLSINILVLHAKVHCCLLMPVLRVISVH